MNILMLTRQHGDIQSIVGKTKNGHKYKIDKLHKPTLVSPDNDFSL